MSSSFDITTRSKFFNVTAGGTCNTELTVTNTSGKPLTGIISATSRSHPNAEWLYLVTPQQEHFDAQASNIIPLSIQTKQNAEIGECIIKFLIADEHNSDEEFSTFDLTLQINQADKKPRRLWPWLLAASCALLFISALIFWRVYSKRATTIPNVVLLPYTEAAAKLRSAGFNPQLAATNLNEVQGEAFQAQSAQLITAIAQKQDAHQDTTEGTQDENDSDVVSEPDLLQNRFVWYQSDDGIATRGSDVVLKVTPQLISVTPPKQFSEEYLKNYFQKQNLFFITNEELPDNYRYGAGLENAPKFHPALSHIFEGTRVSATILPEKLTVPDFTKMNIHQIANYPQFNMSYIYYYAKSDKRNTRKLSVLLDWAKIQKEQNRYVYIYNQIPKPGSKVERDNHLISIEVDSRISALAWKEK